VRKENKEMNEKERRKYRFINSSLIFCLVIVAIGTPILLNLAWTKWYVSIPVIIGIVFLLLSRLSTEKTWKKIDKWRKDA
jgi:hypothetical protein